MRGSQYLIRRLDLTDGWECKPFSLACRHLTLWVYVRFLWLTNSKLNSNFLLHLLNFFVQYWAVCWDLLSRAHGIIMHSLFKNPFTAIQTLKTFCWYDKAILLQSSYKEHEIVKLSVQTFLSQRPVCLCVVILC